jgi:hypothetical protein
MGILPIDTNYLRAGAAAQQTPTYWAQPFGGQGDASLWQISSARPIAGGSVPTVTASALLPPSGLVTPKYDKKDDFNPFQQGKPPLYTTAGFGNARIASYGRLNLMA